MCRYMCEADGARVEGNFSLVPFEPMGDIDECIRRHFQSGSQNNNDFNHYPANVENMVSF